MAFGPLRCISVAQYSFLACSPSKMSPPPPHHHPKHPLPQSAALGSVRRGIMQMPMRFGFELRKLPLKLESLTKEWEFVGPILCKATTHLAVFFRSVFFRLLLLLLRFMK